MQRRYVSLALLLALAATVIVAPAAATPPSAGPERNAAVGESARGSGSIPPSGCAPTFTDVGCLHSFFNEIEWLTGESVVLGFPDGTFRPRFGTSRQAMAALFYRLARSPAEPPGGWPDPGFWDVPGGHPFYDEIAWFASEGYATGYPDGGYHPTEGVTRQTLMAFIYRYLGSPPGPFTDPGFPDVPGAHPFADAIWWAAANGIAYGAADGKFHPTDPVTRQTVAAFLFRLMNFRTPCDDLDPRSCFLPFPNDNFTRPSVTTDTGLVVDLDPGVMPTNDDGVPIDPTAWEQNDGASPGANLLAYVPGIDLDMTGATRITDMSTYDSADNPIVVIDAETGERHPVWAELDARASSDADRLLMIRPSRNFLEGHRYIVGMRNMKDGSGTVIQPSDTFLKFRDSIPTTDPGIELRRPHMEEIFTALETAGLARSELYLAWDFTVASERNLSERILHMRDETFSMLGGSAPSFTVSSTSYDGVKGVTVVEGSFDVPKYFKGSGALARMNYGADGLPDPVGTYEANFACSVPDSATAGDPAQLSLFQHGLFGNALDSIESADDLVNAHNVVFCGTDWISLSSADLLNLPAILDDLSNFPSLSDRGQQGILDTLVLARLMTHPSGLASHPVFRDGASPRIDTSEVVYAGGSQGGIMGGAATAVSTEWTKAFLAVPGQNYSVMLRRSVHWDNLVVPFINYSDELELTIGLSFIQMLWDRSEANGYSQHLVSDPYPGTPAHEVMLFEAFGDHQVANVTTETMARTAGIPIRTPALGAGRSNLDVPFWDIAAVPSLPHSGSALVVWDWGTPAPPITNTAPGAGSDPHGKVLGDATAMAMVAEFLRTGTLVDVCGGGPCTTP